MTQRDGTDLAMEFRAWLVVVAGASAWCVSFGPAVWQLSGRPIVLAEAALA